VVSKATTGWPPSKASETLSETFKRLFEVPLAMRGRG